MRRINYVWTGLLTRMEVVYIFLFALPSLLWAQESQIDFTGYTTREGLIQNSVLTIHQDEKGFMWFGTYGGITRFDGNNAVSFTHNEDNPTSLVDDHVRSISGDTTGVLLVATMSGVDRFFTETGEFVHFQKDPDDPYSLAHNEVFDILKDSEGKIWIATWGAGLNQMVRVPGDYEREQDAKYRFIKHPIYVPGWEKPITNIPRLYEDPSGKYLWITSNAKGLIRFDKQTEEVLSFQHDPKNPNSISSNNVSSLCIDPFGYVWAGTWDAGINRIDLIARQIDRFQKESQNPGSISHNGIMNVFCDNQGSVWIGTWGGGLNKINHTDLKKDNLIFGHYKHSKIDQKSLGSNSIYAFAQDRTGVIWVGTDWGGVSRFDLQKSRFRHIYAEQAETNSLSNNVVFSFFRDQSDNLWIGTLEGLNVYDLATKTYKVYLHDPEDKGSISDNQIKRIAETQDGQIWLGTSKGLNRYNPDTDDFTKYFVYKNNKGTSVITTILPASDGSIWVGTFDYGVYRFFPKTETFEKMDPDGNMMSGSGEPTVWSILEDEDQNIWLGLLGRGLFRFDMSTSQFTKFAHDANDSTSLRNNTVYSLFLDSKKNFWVGTGGGLDKLTYDESGNLRFDHFNPIKEHPTASVYAIEEDELGHIWVTSPNGMARFDLDSYEFQAFTREDGLQDNEFSIGSILKDDRTGEIYAGGINGFNVFYPSLGQRDSVPPSVCVVDLKLFNQSVKTGEKLKGRVMIDKNASAKRGIELLPGENVFTLDYSALHYKSPESIEYAFMLEGFEEDWNYVENQRSATYTNLNPGKYIFKVKAANSDGLWSESPTEFTIIVHPPWWHTNLARVIFATTFILVIVAIYRVRTYNLQQSKKLLEQLVGERTEELSYVNAHLEEKQEEISTQNEQLKIQQHKLEELNDQLVEHKDNLEQLVEVRTKELKKAKLKAEESDRLKSSFLANMSHEVRTPMNAIIGFSTMLGQKNVSATKKRNFIKMIHNSGNTLVKLINDILDISKIDADQLDLFKEDFDIDGILKEVKSYFMLKNGMELELIYANERDKEHPMLNTDPDRFKQVVTNLVSNAIKYTDEGRVVFGYEIKGNELELFVEDTGVGISKEDQKHIFDHFFKVERNKNKFYRGTGIGLSICKKLVRLMGSEIRLESELGRGTRFSFDMPIVKKIKVPEKKKVIKTNGKELKNVNIVVAEDEDTNYQLVHEILSNLGANLYWAKNGEEAVTLTRDLHEKKKKYLVLMDIKMPVKNGIEAMTEIKSFDREVPVMAVTAYAQEGDEKKMIRNGFDDYISKPINAELLVDKIMACS